MTATDDADVRTDHGIDDQDLAQIARYLRKRAHERSVDDLTPADD